MAVPQQRSVQEQVRELTGAMMNLALFVMLRRTVRPERLTPELLLEHLQWMVAQEDAGAVFASGPFEEPGLPRGAAGGLSILRAASIEAATSIADADPLVEGGAVTYKMKTWILMEGDLHVRLSCARRRAVQV
jgi:uncharacterized protein